MSLLRRPFRTLAALSFFGIASTSYLYYRRRDQIALSNETFELSVRVRDHTGKPTTSMRVLPLLPPAEVERRIRRFAKRDSALRNGIRWKWDTAQVAANDPVEDAFASVIVERDPPPTEDRSQEQTGGSAGDLLFFTVLDGHGGPFTSRLLSKTLIPAVALELSSLMHQPIPTASNTLSYLQSFFAPTSSASAPRTFDQSPTYVSLAIQTAFAKLDSELINSPVRLMESLASKLKDDPTSQKPSEDPLALASILPAMSGSCALLAFLDTGARNMYVACTGDSRAVAGYFDDEAGTWTVEVLTEDQTGRNPNELKRMQSEHPPDEKDAVIQRGRVLGGLEPSRAFGDARYKWGRDVQERLAEMFFAGTKNTPRPAPTSLKTPPYVTSQPVITHRALAFLPTPSGSASQPTPRSKMRFLILATDGLWDVISSQDACALVAGHLAGLRGVVPKQDVTSQLKLTVGTQGVEGKNKEKGADLASGSWTFKDTNLATHLVRNAFGAGNEQKLRRLMSIPPPLARSYRDDTTVTVVWWEEGKEAEAEAETRQVKAKL